MDLQADKLLLAQHRDGRAANGDINDNRRRDATGHFPHEWGIARGATGRHRPAGSRLPARPRAANLEGMLKPLADCRLYTFVDTAYLHGRDPAELARRLCAGGSDLIQLRAKNQPPDVVRRLAESILPITRAAGVWFVVNDHLEIARAVGADICHLGQEDFFDAGHRHVDELRRPGDSLCIGLSTHAPDQCRRALAAGADYVAIGPVYSTGTKPTARPVTLEYVRWAATQVRLPWFAIGGINRDTLDDVLAAGATRVCVVSAILNARDVAAECRHYRDRLAAA